MRKKLKDTLYKLGLKLMQSNCNHYYVARKKLWNKNLANMECRKCQKKEQHKMYANLKEALDNLPELSNYRCSGYGVYVVRMEDCFSVNKNYLKLFDALNCSYTVVNEGTGSISLVIVNYKNEK